jgi:hypothetical protein
LLYFRELLEPIVEIWSFQTKIPLHIFFMKILCMMIHTSFLLSPSHENLWTKENRHETSYEGLFMNWFLGICSFAWSHHFAFGKATIHLTGNLFLCSRSTDIWFWPKVKTKMHTLKIIWGTQNYAESTTTLQRTCSSVNIHSQSKAFWSQELLLFLFQFWGSLLCTTYQHLNLCGSITNT